MFTVRKSDDRGATGASWLKSLHSFSFSDYYDPQHMGFGPLRVINEDWVAPESGFDTHGHKNMEIITYVLSGALTHKDSLGTGSTIRPGEIQMMSAGKGILHSEHNKSAAEDVHLLQIWIMPDQMNGQPEYQQKTFPAEDMHNRFRLVVSEDGAEGSLVMKQKAKLFAATITAGETISFPVAPERKYWLQIARGALDFQEQPLEAGDGLAIEKEHSILSLTARRDAEVLLFDLPQ
ncbi:MAG: pirin family protein [Alphaproteobacteria bacterium]|nr:pirin family protein [Alphaproteobacteria bacterium]